MKSNLFKIPLAPHFHQLVPEPPCDAGRARFGVRFPQLCLGRSQRCEHRHGRARAGLCDLFWGALVLRACLHQDCFTGLTPPWADPKDLILLSGAAIYRQLWIVSFFEFTGSGASNMSMSNRLTIATHGVELGAKFVVFDYDEKTEEFLKHYRSDFDPKLVTPVSADPAATYEKELMINLDEIEPLVAKPHVFENIAPLSEVVGTSHPAGTDRLLR